MLKDGRGFLWTTERNGARQLELHSADGAPGRGITPLDFGLEKFVGAIESDLSVLVTGGAA